MKYLLAIAIRSLVLFGAALGLVVPSVAGAAGIETPAKQAVLIEADTGAVLVDKESRSLMPPASMTKLMTVLMIFDRLKSGELSLDDTFLVSKKAWQMGGSKMFVLVDTEIRVEDLLRGIVIQSGNDACVVIAEGISGTEEAFANAMTERAQEIGMENTTFRNSTGWPDPEHLTTAYDLAKLAQYLITEHAEYYHYFSETSFVWEGITQENRNPLLFLNVGADGLKTGHTEASGYGLVGSAIRDDRRLILVVNGLQSEKQRSSESRRLMDVGFREFKSYALFGPGEKVEYAKVWQGASKRISLVSKEPVRVIMRRSDRKKMEVKVTYQGPVVAPVLANTQVGTLHISAPGFVGKTVPLYTAEDVPELGLMGQMAAALRYLVFGVPES